MKPIEYRFIIRYDEEEREVHPTYKNDLSLEHELESNQQFFRKKLSGKLTFLREDYDFLNSHPFDTEFILLMQETKDGGKTWGEIFRGKFMKTDCTWNDDDKKCEVNPSAYDEYNDVIAGLDKEYNLIKLSPEIRRLTLQKRPLIQVYLAGDSVVSCFLSGTYWEQEVIEPVTDESTLIGTYHFAKANTYQEIFVSQSPYDDLTNEVFVGTKEDGYSSKAKYKLEYFEEVVAGSQFATLYNGLKLYKDEIVCWQFSQSSPTTEGYKELPTTITLSPVCSETANVVVEITTNSIFMRYLLDLEQFRGKETYQISTNDIVDNNRNYKRCIGYGFNTISISKNYSTAPQQYGVRPDGNYYLHPYYPGKKFYPVARSKWNYASYWFSFSEIDLVVEQEGRKEFELRDTYPIHSVIKVLLEQFSDITHEGTEEYSKFLYGAYNPLTSESLHLLMSPKSNVLHGNYDQPAMKAQTTLGTILNMLRNVYKCYWYIEDGKLKIEHILFFRNGGTYYYNTAIGVDLTALEVIRNGKKWGFQTSSYEYEKSAMPERYQFAWMDDVSEAFEGYPIEVISKYVSEGQIEEVTVTGFTTDIDYMLLNPGAISQDGFALFAARYVNNRYELPFVDVEGMKLQNGYLSWIYLHPNYLSYDLPSRNVVINQEDYYVYDISRNKKQTVKFPAIDTIDTTKLIKTYIGNGQIEKISVNLSSRINEVTLKYDTE